jgi:hypothetical protein
VRRGERGACGGGLHEVQRGGGRRGYKYQRKYLAVGEDVVNWYLLESW